MRKERNDTHGVFADNAQIAQQFKELLVPCVERRMVEMGATVEEIRVVKEFLDRQSTKFARLAQGNPLAPEHYEDIAGYAEETYDYLVSDRETEEIADIEPKDSPLEQLANKAHVSEIGVWPKVGYPYPYPWTNQRYRPPQWWGAADRGNVFV